MQDPTPPEAGRISEQDTGTDAREDNLVHEVPFGFRGNLKFISKDKEYEPSFFTYEGMRRCGKDGCRQLWGIYQHRCDEPVGICFARCDECWMPVPGGAAGRAQLQRHGAACRGQVVRAAWKPAWDGTLHCPLCGFPGLTVDKMKQHLSVCDGNRRSVLGGGSVPTGHDPRSLRICDECEFTFHPSVFATHVCGSTYDPVWLGDTDVPDMTKPYIVWCRDGPGPYGPCGYGGGYIGDDPGGRIPQEVYDASWSVPFSTNPRYALGPSNTLFDLVRDLRRLLAPAAAHSDDDADDADDNIEAGSGADVDQLVAETGTMDLGGKIDRVREECAAQRGRRNARTLVDHNIRPKKIQAGPCQGVGWRHGFIPCRSGPAISLDTAALEARESSGKVSWALICPECRRLQSSIHAWVMRGKYNADGTRLCPADSCREPVFNGVECQAHAALRSARRVRAKKARLSTHDARASTRRRRIWDIVSPDDMKSFFAALQQMPTPPWSNDERWSRIADAVADKHPVPNIFLIDTETVVVNHTPKPLELSILRACGEHLYTTTVDYGVDVADLCRGIGQQLLGYAIGIYSREGANTAHARIPTHGQTPEAVASRLREIGLGRGSVLIEWSESGWDWRALRALCGEASVPGEYLRGEDLLRLCGYRGPMDLETLYYLCFPDCPLHRRHHRARWDVRKLHRVLCYILAPSLALGRVPDETSLARVEDASSPRGAGGGNGSV